MRRRTTRRKDDLYFCVMIFQRKKDIPELKKSTKCVFQDFAKLNQIKERLEMYNLIAEKLNARIYISVNARNVREARKDLMIRLIKTEDNGREPTNIQSQMFSSLMKYPLKEGKKFIVDIDNKNKKSYDEVIWRLITHDFKIVDTKNGWHLICDPFDIRILKGIEDVEIKTDGMTNINYVNK